MRSVKREYESHSYQKGEIFGRLTLTGKSYLKEMFGQRRRIVEADCSCGVTRMYVFHLLVRGDTKSCGCYRKDVTREMATTHGKKSHPLYDVYYAMLKRCYDEKDEGYKNYGGRGISVCERWQEDFLFFYNWAIQNGWGNGLSLDRKNNDGNYYPDNCHFTSRAVQGRNNRRNRMFSAFGETKCMTDWANDKRCKVTFGCLRSRLDRDGWTDIEEAIITPLVSKKESQRKMKSNKLITAFGETKTQSEWLEDKRCVVKVDGLRDRLKSGWEPERAITTAPQPSKNKKPVIESARENTKVDSLF